MLPLYLLAITSLLVGTAAIYMALIKSFPVQWLYYHYFVRKPVVWAILIGSTAWTLWATERTGVFPQWALVPLLLMGLAILLSYKMHQENAFQAVDFPVVADDPFALPLTDKMQLAVIEHRGVTKAYPLDYIIHHHIVNDRFGDRIVALTFCAMCRSIIPFDVTDIGPLFVGSFKNANMIVADRNTKTFFQQATFESIIGKLHPHTLTMIPFQILAWGDLKRLDPLPLVVQTTPEDFRQFQLPIPGIWNRIMASEATPGLPADERDKTFPSRTHVVGITDRFSQTDVVYLKDELMNKGIVHDEALNVYLVAVGNTVNGFRGSLAGTSLNLLLNSDNTLIDDSTATVWDVRGKRVEGNIELDLESIALSDEYWFSWKRFHPTSKLVRV